MLLVELKTDDLLANRPEISHIMRGGIVHRVINQGQMHRSLAMELDNPSVLLSGVLIGAVGMGLFIYGKKSADYRALLMGVSLSVLPLLAHTMLVLWGLTGACAALMYAARRFG